MLSCCAFNSSCSSEAIGCPSRGETANGDIKQSVEKEDQNAVEDQYRMDIALLREQYNWTKEKQKLQTRVVLFRQVSADDPAEVSGPSLVNVVPVIQEMKSTADGKRWATKFDVDSAGDLERNPWRTHLEVHRRTHSIVLSHLKPTVTCSNSSSVTSLSGGCFPTPDDIFGGDSNYIHTAETSTSKTLSVSRKFSEPAVLTRQLSCEEPQPSHPLSSNPHYPFPKQKRPSKSEAARRLGMYASF